MQQSENPLFRMEDALMASLDEIDNAKTEDELAKAIKRANVRSSIGKIVVGLEQTKVMQARVLVDAGLKAAVGDVIFLKTDKDSHPKRLN